MADIDIYTGDGTVDIKGKHVVRRNECCERLAYYGMSTNLVNYLIVRLNQGSAQAANNVTNWSGTCYIAPLFGAFLADAYLGRFWGMTLLTLSASINGLKPSCHGDKCHATTGNVAIFFVALYLIALGTGGTKPCVSSFGADQFDKTDEEEKKRKSSFFNWFYFTINVDALVASSFLIYIQEHVGWGWRFGIPAVMMALEIVFFFSGSKLYRNQKPGGSPLTRIAQVLIASVRKCNVEVPADRSLLYETEDAVQTEHDQVKVKGVSSPWKLCTVTRVEELKSIVRILPIWTTGIIFSTVYSQMSTLFVEQGDKMDPSMGPHFNIPAAALSSFYTLRVIAWFPIYDRIIVPFVRKHTGHERGFTQLQQMGIGLVISIFSMVVAAAVEIIRLDLVKKHNNYDLKHMSMSIFWQFPQYFLIGAAEVFTFIGQLEFFYDQAPDAMRSLCSALSLTTNALGNYLSIILVTIVTRVTTKSGKLGWITDNLNHGHLDYFFWLLALLSVLNFLAYLWIASWHKYKKTAGGFN